MSNRMGVLIASSGALRGRPQSQPFPSFSSGYFHPANNKGQVVFFVAGLSVGVSLRYLLLHGAHGFAWALIPEKPAEAKKPVERAKAVESTSSEDAKRSIEPLKPVAEMKPAETMKLAETMKPAESMRPEDASRSYRGTRSLRRKWKPAETMKPAEEKVIAPVDPPDAKYTIAGKRIH